MKLTLINTTHCLFINQTPPQLVGRRGTQRRGRKMYFCLHGAQLRLDCKMGATVATPFQCTVATGTNGRPTVTTVMGSCWVTPLQPLEIPCPVFPFPFSPPIHPQELQLHISAAIPSRCCNGKMAVRAPRNMSAHS